MIAPVSYTHLDVYKRQAFDSDKLSLTVFPAGSDKKSTFSTEVFISNVFPTVGNGRENAQLSPPTLKQHIMDRLGGRRCV